MAVSVRMNPLLEKELELAARRQGLSKSQFIIAAVERALGRRDPAALYHQVREDAAHYTLGHTTAEVEARDRDSPLRKSLRAGYERQQDEYAAWLKQREAAREEPT